MKLLLTYQDSPGFCGKGPIKPPKQVILAIFRVKGLIKIWLNSFTSLPLQP